MNRVIPNGPYPVFGPSRGLGWWWLPALALTIVLIVVAIAIVLALLRWWRARLLWPPNHQSGHYVDPEQVLEQRLARGEIDVEEFRERLAALRQGRERPSR